MARNMTDHMLTPLKHFWQGSHLVTNGSVDENQAELFEYEAIPAGRCMHLTAATGVNEVPVAALGCDGNEKIPVWLFRDSDSYSAGFNYKQPDPTTYTGPSWNNGVEQKLLMFVGLEGFELMTTEFDSTKTYAVGQYLVAPEADPAAPDQTVEVRTVAGIVTNDVDGAGQKPRYGLDTVVGMVSPGFASPMQGEYSASETGDEYNNEVLSLYTTYRPPVEALPAGIPSV